MQINVFIFISLAVCLLHNVNASIPEKHQVSSTTETPNDWESISEKYYLKQELNNNDRNHIQKKSLELLNKRINQKIRINKRQTNLGEEKNFPTPTTAAITNNDPTKVVNGLLNTVTGLLNKIGLGINPNETLSLNNVINELTGHVTNLNGDHELLNDKNLIGLIRTLIDDVDKILGSKGCKEDLSGKLDLDGEDDDDDLTKREKLNNDIDKDTENDGDSDHAKDKDNNVDNEEEGKVEEEEDRDKDDERKVKRDNSSNDNDDENEIEDDTPVKNAVSADKCDNNSGTNNFDLLEQVLGFVKNLLLDGKGNTGQIPVVLQSVTKLVKVILGNTVNDLIQKPPVSNINNSNPNTGAKRSLLRRALLKKVINKRR